MVTTSSTAAAAATQRGSAAGDDTFVWNPGDGSDVVDGQDGFDTLQFNDANIAETVNISANGSRTRLTRDIGGVTMDLGTMERIQIAALGGARPSTPPKPPMRTDPSGKRGCCTRPASEEMTSLPSATSAAARARASPVPPRTRMRTGRD